MKRKRTVARRPTIIPGITALLVLLFFIPFTVYAHSDLFVNIPPVTTPKGIARYYYDGQWELYQGYHHHCDFCTRWNIPLWCEEGCLCPCAYCTAYQATFHICKCDKCSDPDCGCTCDSDFPCTCEGCGDDQPSFPELPDVKSGRDRGGSSGSMNGPDQAPSTFEQHASLEESAQFETPITPSVEMSAIPWSSSVAVDEPSVVDFPETTHHPSIFIGPTTVAAISGAKNGTLLLTDRIDNLDNTLINVSSENEHGKENSGVRDTFLFICGGAVTAFGIVHVLIGWICRRNTLRKMAQEKSIDI